MSHMLWEDEVLTMIVRQVQREWTGRRIILNISQRMGQVMLEKRSNGPMSGVGLEDC